VAKWGFDENLPRVRPRVRLGRGPEGDETLTQPPAPRDADEVGDPGAEAIDAPAAEPVVVESDTLPVDELDAAFAQAALLAEPDLATATFASLPEVDALPELPSDLPMPSDLVENPLPETFADAASVVAPEAVPAVAPPLGHATDDAPVDAAVVEARRAALKRAAAGLSGLEVDAPAPAATLSPLDDLDALTDAAELAAELERALAEASETNEALRRDLSVALDDLARTTAETRRLGQRIDRLESEARERTRVVQDLVRELELLEGERDGALLQSSSAALATERAEERVFATERRVQELERQLVDARARTQRYEEAAAAQVAQRTALRAELDAVRRERDGLLASNARLERERDDHAKSRRALDEVHRALSEARSRAQRLRPR
jgi:hypothetical protein